MKLKSYMPNLAKYLSTTIFISTLILAHTSVHSEVNLTEKQKVGYSFGYKMAQGNRESLSDLDVKAFYLGFRSGYLDKQPLLSDSEMEKVLMDYQTYREKEILAELETKQVDNLAEANAFLAKNKEKLGVKTTESGLQYRVLNQGSGANPTVNDIVSVHYEGKFIDGTVFDSSYQRGKSSDFPLNAVIDGWIEGIQLMNKGAKFQLFIPPHLAYKEVGTTGIPPNSLLIFTVELVDFKAK